MKDDSSLEEICNFCDEVVKVSRDNPRCINCGKKLFFTEEEREKLKQLKEEQKKSMKKN